MTNYLLLTLSMLMMSLYQSQPIRGLWSMLATVFAKKMGEKKLDMHAMPLFGQQRHQELLLGSSMLEGVLFKNIGSFIDRKLSSGPRASDKVTAGQEFDSVRPTCYVISSADSTAYFKSLLRLSMLNDIFSLTAHGQHTCTVYWQQH